MQNEQTENSSGGGSSRSTVDAADEIERLRSALRSISELRAKHPRDPIATANFALQIADTALTTQTLFGEAKADEIVRMKEKLAAAKQALVRLSTLGNQYGISSGNKIAKDAIDKLNSDDTELRLTMMAPNALAQADAACGVSPGAMG